MSTIRNDVIRPCVFNGDAFKFHKLASEMTLTDWWPVTGMPTDGWRNCSAYCFFVPRTEHHPHNWIAYKCHNLLRHLVYKLYGAVLLNLHSHDLRVPVGSLSRFRLSLTKCNVPGVFNCMSGRFSSLYWRYLCISYENYKYWQNAKVNPSSNTQQKVSGKFMLPPS